jgi:hypothetical protein
LAWSWCALGMDDAKGPCSSKESLLTAAPVFELPKGPL